MKNVSKIFLGLFLFTQLGAVAEVSEHDIPNFREVKAGLFRGGRPTKNGLEELRKMGVRTVVNLEDAPFAVKRERQILEELGIRMVSIPLSSFSKPKNENINAALALLSDPASEPIFVHCHHGEDRTGLIVGLFRVEQQQWSAQDAYREMIELGFHRSLISLDNYYRIRTRLNLNQ